MSLDKPPPIPREEYAERRARAASAARELGLDGLLVWSMGGSTLDAYADVFYLTNHYSPEPKSTNRPPRTGFGHTALVLPVDGDPVLVVNLGARSDLVAVDDIRSGPDLYGSVLACIDEKGLGAGRIGLAREQFVPLPFYHGLREAYPDAELVPAEAILDRMRMVKSPAELALMRHAQAVAVEIMNAMLAEVDVGRTDADLASVGFSTASRLGATPYEFAMASGPDAGHYMWSRLPTFDPWRRYERGDVVHPDVYGCVDGYMYDFQRTTVVGGEPSDEQRETMEAVVAVVHHVASQLRPGRRASDVHGAAVEWIAAQNWESNGGGLSVVAFPSFGHGIGLGFERPGISATEETVLVPGMTIATEMFVSREGAETAIHEEIVLVTDGEPEILTAGCRPRWWR
jgi:Xaa-Pro aminopeptidase